MKGWISLHRKIRCHPFYKERRKFSRFEAWVDMLLEANHADNKWIAGNEVIPIKRGSFITSELNLMERWQWSKTKVRSFLKLLEEEKMIVKKSDSKKTTIFIVNYDNYQGLETAEEPEKDQKKTAKKPQKDTNNNVNNVNKVDPPNSESEFADDSLEMKMTKYMIEKIVESYPSAKVPNTPTKLHRWCLTFDHLMRIDGRSREEIREVMKWVYQDDFWCTNIRSPEKLREKFDTLWLQMRGQAKKKGDVQKLKPGQKVGESDADYVRRLREKSLKEQEEG